MSTGFFWATQKHSKWNITCVYVQKIILRPFLGRIWPLAASDLKKVSLWLLNMRISQNCLLLAKNESRNPYGPSPTCNLAASGGLLCSRNGLHRRFNKQIDARNEFRDPKNQLKRHINWLYFEIGIFRQFWWPWRNFGQLPLPETTWRWQKWIQQLKKKRKWD